MCSCDCSFFLKKMIILIKQRSTYFMACCTLLKNVEKKIPKIMLLIKIKHCINLGSTIFTRLREKFNNNMLILTGKRNNSCKYYIFSQK